MPTRRSRSGARSGKGRRHVGLTTERRTKAAALEAAALLDWSAGDWVLAVAAEHGPPLTAEVAGAQTARPVLDEPTFWALYLTVDERDELDDLARRCGLSRSAYVTACADLALGAPLDVVVGRLTGDATPG